VVTVAEAKCEACTDTLCPAHLSLHVLAEAFGVEDLHYLPSTIEAEDVREKAAVLSHRWLGPVV